jgi:hypothetical protein
MDILTKNGIEFVTYDIQKFAESCCVDLPTMKAPSVFAPEGVFKELGGIQKYIASSAEAAGDKNASEGDSESAYW